MNIPKALLLDFGAVVSVSLFERHRQNEIALGLPVGALSWLGPINPRTDALWQAMQRDEMTEREYWAERAKMLGFGDMHSLLHTLTPKDPNQVVRPEIMSLLKTAKAAGIKLGVLSNELELFYGPAFCAGLEVLTLMDTIVDATHTGILKPDPRAYQLALDGLGLAAEDVLFVDDQFRNIAGAVKCGLQTQYFDLRDVGGHLAALAARLRLPLNC
ncbi:MAG: hypothetical protein RLZZ502_1560 [Pseudomonadota bacterium]|jgi:putative hydrolase of the HAD superfamily